MPHPAWQLSNSPVCLSPELSLDVDADRDGVVEKNNPKKVPRCQGRLTGGFRGRAPGWVLKQPVLPGSTGSSQSPRRRLGPETGSPTHHTP